MKAMVVVATAFFFVFENKKMTIMHRHLLLWRCCSDEGDGNYYCAFFFVFEKKKTMIMCRHPLLWKCCNDEGDNNCYRHLLLFV